MSWAKHEPKAVRLVIGSNSIDCTIESSFGFLRLSACQVGNQHPERDANCAYGHNRTAQFEMPGSRA
jgi:hypothetical protein